MKRLKTLYSENRLNEAVELAQNVDWAQVDSLEMIETGATLFERAGEYMAAKDLWRRIYKRSPLTQKALQRLTVLALRCDSFDEADAYATEFIKRFPKDPQGLYLRYKVLRGRGAPVDECIVILEELQTKDYREPWMLELAFEYERAGLIEKCVAQCEDIDLWFNAGEYVRAALRLKKKYKPLSKTEELKLVMDPVSMQPEDDEEIFQVADREEPPSEATINVVDDIDHDVKVYRPKVRVDEISEEPIAIEVPQGVEYLAADHFLGDGEIRPEQNDAMPSRSDTDMGPTAPLKEPTTEEAVSMEEKPEQNGEDRTGMPETVVKDKELVVDETPAVASQWRSPIVPSAVSLGSRVPSFLQGLTAPTHQDNKRNEAVSKPFEKADLRTSKSMIQQAEGSIREDEKTVLANETSAVVDEADSILNTTDDLLREDEEEDIMKKRKPVDINGFLDKFQGMGNQRKVLDSETGQVNEPHRPPLERSVKEPYEDASDLYADYDEYDDDLPYDEDEVYDDYADDDIADDADYLDDDEFLDESYAAYDEEVVDEAFEGYDDDYFEEPVDDTEADIDESVASFPVDDEDIDDVSEGIENAYAPTSETDTMPMKSEKPLSVYRASGSKEANQALSGEETMVESIGSGNIEESNSTVPEETFAKDRASEDKKKRKTIRIPLVRQPSAERTEQDDIFDAFMADDCYDEVRVKEGSDATKSIANDHSVENIQMDGAISGRNHRIVLATDTTEETFERPEESGKVAADSARSDAQQEKPLLVKEASESGKTENGDEHEAIDKTEESKQTSLTESVAVDESENRDNNVEANDTDAIVLEDSSEEPMAEEDAVSDGLSVVEEASLVEEKPEKTVQDLGYYDDAQLLQEEYYEDEADDYPEDYTVDIPAELSDRIGNVSRIAYGVSKTDYDEALDDEGADHLYEEDDYFDEEADLGEADRYFTSGDGYPDNSNAYKIEDEYMDHRLADLENEQAMSDAVDEADLESYDEAAYEAWDDDAFAIDEAEYEAYDADETDYDEVAYDEMDDDAFAVDEAEYDVYDAGAMDYEDGAYETDDEDDFATEAIDYDEFDADEADDEGADYLEEDYDASTAYGDSNDMDGADEDHDFEASDYMAYADEEHYDAAGYAMDDEAYYDEDGYAIDDASYYDEDGNPVDDEAYYDEDGNPIDDVAYYDEDGYPIDDEAYYDEDGYPIDDEAYYDEDGYAIDDAGYYDEDGYYVDDAGYYVDEDGYAVDEADYVVDSDGYYVDENGYFIDGHDDAVVTEYDVDTGKNGAGYAAIHGTASLSKKQSSAADVGTVGLPAADGRTQAGKPAALPKENERKTFEYGDIGQEAKDLIEKMDNLEVVKNYKKMNIILYGETEQGLNRFAEEYARSRGAYVNRKVARVDAEKLSRINIRKLYEKFQNTFLLVRNVPTMTEETYNNFIKYNKENKNTVFLFLVKYGENISTFHNHLFKKMVGVEESLPYAENDVLSYAVLYAALRGYRFSEAAVDELYQCERCRSDEDPEFDPYEFMEKVVRAAINKQRHYNEENILTNLVTGRYHNDESVIGKHSTVEAVWQCMGEAE